MNNKTLGEVLTKTLDKVVEIETKEQAKIMHKLTGDRVGAYRNGTGFRGYLNTTYEALEKAFGPASDKGSLDGKIQTEWVFKTRGKMPTVLTIYDYKESQPVSKVTEWHIGGKGDIQHTAADFLRAHGFSVERLPCVSGPLQSDTK